MGAVLEAIRCAVEQATSDTGAEGASVWRASGFEFLEAVSASGPVASQIEGLVLPRERGVVGEVALSGDPLLVASSASADRVDREVDVRTGYRTANLLAVPVQIDSKVIGVLEVVNSTPGREFTKRDSNALGDIARSLAESLHLHSLEKDLSLSAPYLSPLLLDGLSRGRIVARSATASVLFADLEGFTSVSRQVDPRRAYAILDAFHRIAEPIIASAGGLVDKHSGDDVLAVFEPRTGGNTQQSAWSALGVAVLLVERINRSHVLDIVSGGPPISLRVGIGTGKIEIGPLGGEFKDFTVTGQVVNEAKKLQISGSPGSITIDQATYEACFRQLDSSLRSVLHVRLDSR